jgi:tetratricopeptide (TPR) repeat protein
MKNTSKAETLYLEAIKMSPKNWETYFGYGYFLTSNGRYDEAIENYQKVLEFTPNNHFALNNLGINYYYKNEFKDAANAFEKAAKLEPAGEMFANTGTMYYSSGNLNKAVEMLEKALRLQPSDYRYMIYIADAYKFMPGKKYLADTYINNAMKIIRNEIAQNPNIAKSYQYLARGLAYFGELKEANDMMALADALDYSSTDCFYAHLRIAILESKDEKIREYAQHLLDAEYSDKLLLADPDFAVLKEAKFKDLFIRKK